MNLFRKIVSIALYPDSSRKELVDFAILITVCFLIVVYKVLKS